MKTKEAISTWIRKEPWRAAFLGLMAVAFLLICSIYKDFSITNDEPIHHVHGQVILDYFLGNDSTAGLSPIDSSGKLIRTFNPARDEYIRGMNFFGGFPDLLIAAMVKALPDADEYYIRHFMTALWGLLALFVAGLIARMIGGWRAAFLAALILWLSPRFFGHSFYNPKDLPFAAAYLTGLYFILAIVQRLPRFAWKHIALFIPFLGISIATRVSGLLLPAYLGLALFVWWWMNYRSAAFEKQGILAGFKLLLLTVFVGFSGYAATTLFWPFAAESFAGPFKVLGKLTHFEVFDAYELYFGRWYNSPKNPWHYVFVWTFITLPLTYVFGLVLSPLLFRKEGGRAAEGNFVVLATGLLLFAALFPPLYVIIKKSVVYNEARHLLFIVPPLAVITALSFDRIFRLLRNTAFQYLAIAVFLVFTLEPARWMLRNHPNQGMYFSPLTGGIEGAFKRFEMDYWSVSILPAIKWLAANSGGTEQTPVRVKMFYGEQIKVTHFTDRYFKNLVFAPGNRSDNWDYQIKFTVEAKFDTTVLFTWPPKGTVHEIKAGNVPLCAIVKNPYYEQLKEFDKRIIESVSAAELIGIGLELYNMNDYNRALRATRRAAELDPGNAIAYNNLCSGYNKLEMYELAAEAGKKALLLNPGFTLASANLDQSLKGLEELQKKPRQAYQYLNLSYQLYLQEDYDNSIEMCYEALKLEPGNASAYNNICSIYNVQGKYELAKKACEKALELQPDFTLARNNLEESIKGMQRTKNSPAP